jgi:hypothetical protein
VIGGLGLALLIAAPRRDLRRAGLLGWAVGCALLAVYLAPHGHHRVLFAAAVVGVLCAAGGAWVVLRVPWLLAVATLACVPARIPVHVGSTQANLLLPLYAVVAVAAVALAWELFGDDERSRELGPLAWPFAAFVAWEGLSLGGRGRPAGRSICSSCSRSRGSLSRDPVVEGCCALMQLAMDQSSPCGSSSTRRNIF